MLFLFLVYNFCISLLIQFIFQLLYVTDRWLKMKIVCRGNVTDKQKDVGMWQNDQFTKQIFSTVTVLGFAQCTEVGAPNEWPYMVLFGLNSIDFWVWCKWTTHESPRFWFFFNLCTISYVLHATKTLLIFNTDWFIDQSYGRYSKICRHILYLFIF